MNAPTKFLHRKDAGLHLAARLKGRPFHNPLVLAIPRGGVVIGAILAKELGAELDVVLSRKLRAPSQPELAVGAISEDGQAYLNESAEDALIGMEGYLHKERQHQLAEIEQRKHLVRSVRPQASIQGRTVIVTDDGLATGSTMIAALQSIRPRHPERLIVAVPVGSPDRLADVAKYCDEVVHVLAPQHFWTIGQFYDNFDPVEDEQMIRLLRESAPREKPASESKPERI